MKLFMENPLKNYTNFAASNFINLPHFNIMFPHTPMAKPKCFYAPCGSNETCTHSFPMRLILRWHTTLDLHRIIHPNDPKAPSHPQSWLILARLAFRLFYSWAVTHRHSGSHNRRTWSTWRWRLEGQKLTLLLTPWQYFQRQQLADIK